MQKIIRSTCVLSALILSGTVPVIAYEKGLLGTILDFFITRPTQIQQEQELIQRAPKKVQALLKLTLQAVASQDRKERGILFGRIYKTIETYRHEWSDNSAALQLLATIQPQLDGYIAGLRQDIQRMGYVRMGETVIAYQYSTAPECYLFMNELVYEIVNTRGTTITDGGYTYSLWSAEVEYALANLIKNMAIAYNNISLI